MSPLRCGILFLAVALAEIASAQGQYPTRPVRIVVPTSPGSGSDILARLISQALTERLGQQVVVDNRAGASTMIGGELVAKSPPDGHTLLLGISTLAINPATFKKVPYDVLRDFAPITRVATVPNLLAVHPSLPAKTVKELIALAKARPGDIVFSSAGHGTNPHLCFELFLVMSHIRMLHVPYKGGSASVIGLLSGHVSAGMASVLTMIAHVRASRLRALGVTSVERAAPLPDVPAIAEAGVPGYEAVQWYGLLAPAGTPREIIARLNKEVVAVLLRQDMRERFANDGAETVTSSPEEFTAFLRAETLKWAKVVKSAGIQPE